MKGRGAARAGRSKPRSFDVLHLLAKLLDRGFQGEADPGQREVGRFRAQRVGLAVELLAEEVEAPADCRALGEEVARGGDMRLEAIELLADVGAADEERSFLREAFLRQRRAGFE